MVRRGRDDESGGLDALDRVFAVIEEAPAGLHDLAPIAANLPPGLPPPLIELYARCDGGRLYFDSVEIAPSAEVVHTDDRWTFATLDGEEVSLDDRGRVWRFDASLEDHVCEGTRLDRWLSGTVDALALLYDAEGEFAEDLFDEEGELLPKIGENQLRAQLKRDASAPGPRWRLAHALLAQGNVEDARQQLEEVVAKDPQFAWAWLDLARISERVGEATGAIDEARAGAEAAVGHPQAGYFWAQVARIATRAGDESTRVDAARRASELAPDLKAAQIAGARSSLEEGDIASARGLLEILRAVWPRDLEVLALVRKIDN
jgi:Tfp pilus assembly protein PilF